MNQMEIFKNPEFGSVRVIEENGKYLFCGVDVAKALGYINEHLDEDLSLTSVARHIFISPCYLCKIFKPLTGQTFVSYVNGQRINLAKKLLLSTDQKIDDIAAACGFHTASYFSTLFRKHNGMSPANFRSQGRKSVSADRLAPQAG